MRKKCLHKNKELSSTIIGDISDYKTLPFNIRPEHFIFVCNDCDEKLELSKEEKEIAEYSFKSGRYFAKTSLENDVQKVFEKFKEF